MGKSLRGDKKARRASSLKDQFAKANILQWWHGKWYRWSGPLYLTFEVAGFAATLAMF